MSTSKLIPISMSLMLLSACSGIDSIPNPAADIAPMDCYFPNVEPRQEAPNWVCTGYIEGVVTGKGTYDNSETNYDLAYQVAQLRARKDLAQKLETRLSGFIDDYQAQTATSSGQALDSHSRQAQHASVDAVLNGTRVIHAITDPNHTLHLLVGIDSALAAGKLARHLKTGYGDDEVEHIKHEALAALKEIEKH